MGWSASTEAQGNLTRPGGLCLGGSEGAFRANQAATALNSCGSCRCPHSPSQDVADAKLRPIEESAKVARVILIQVLRGLCEQTREPGAGILNAENAWLCPNQRLRHRHRYLHRAFLDSSKEACTAVCFVLYSAPWLRAKHRVRRRRPGLERWPS